MPFHNSWLGYKIHQLYRSGISYYLCAADTTSLTRASSVADFVAAELLQEDGYQRQLITWPSDGTYSNANQRWELPTVTVAFQAVGASFQFQTVWVMAGANANASKIITGPNIDPATNRIILASHTLAAGDKFILSPEAGASLAGTGLTAGTLYTALNPTTNNFQPSADGVNPITITGAATGNINLKYASGTIVSFGVNPNPVLVQAGQSVEYDIDFVEFNAAYGPGV